MAIGLGKVGRLGFIGLSPTARIKGGSPVPDFTRSFDAVTRKYSTIVDYAFGTENAPAGAEQIDDISALSAVFQDYRNGEPKPATRNTENQRYVDFSSSANLVFEADALEIRATLPNGSPAGMSQTTLAADVVYSREIEVADASTISVGQILSLGDQQLANQHVTTTVHAFGTITVGDTTTLTVSFAADMAMANIIITHTVVAGDTSASIASDFVAQINANASLSALNVYAFQPQALTGAFAIIAPAWSAEGSPPFGALADGSLRWISFAAAKTGTVTFELKQRTITTFVTGKVGNILTLNHPVTAAAGDVLHVNPCHHKFRRTAYAGGSNVVPLSDTDGIEVGQAIQISYNDTNLRYVIAKTADTITVSATVYVTDGVMVTTYPVFIAAVNAASSGTVLSFASVPASIRVGMQAQKHQENPNSNLRVVAINRSSSPQTVTLDGNLAVSNGNAIAFYEPIHSVEAWTKDGWCPGADGHEWIAMELEADFPDAADIAAWPAFWIFRDQSNLTGIDAPVGGAYEIDMTDTFNYWSNISLNCFQPQGGVDGNNLYSSADRQSPIVQGNNLGRQTRKIQIIWSATAYYAYIDGVLKLARNFVYNNSARAQVSFNLAMGSTSTSFNGNGFFPLDFSRFPMKYRIKRMRILAA